MAVSENAMECRPTLLQAIATGQLKDRNKMERRLGQIQPRHPQVNDLYDLDLRVKAHILVAFPGYALWVTLKHLLKRRPPIVPTPSASGVDNAQPMTPMRAIALLSTLQSADIILPATDGREIRLRRITEPTAEQKSLLRQLGIGLPEHLRFQRECSANSAIA